MKIFKGIALAFGLLVVVGVLWLLLIATHWLPRPTAEEQQAVALLNSEAAKIDGKANAFAALYLLDRNVPESEWEAIAATDLALLDSAAPPADQPTMTAEQFPLFAKLSVDSDLLCTQKSRPCVQRVRAHPEAARAALAQGRDLLDRAERLERYDHYRSPIPAHYNSPSMLGLGDYSTLALTEAALLHVDGDSAAAHRKLCTFASTWRRLRSNANTLIVTMLGTNYVNDAIALRAELLSEWPPSQPAPCPEVFAPLSESESDLCAAMANEFHLFASGTREIGAQPLDADDASNPPPGSGATSRLFNVEHTIRMSAPFYASFCQPDHHEKTRTRSAASAVTTPRCSVSAWALNPIGCILVPIGAPSYLSYYHRVLDLDAHLRLAQAAQWLRHQDAAEPAAAFASRPSEFDSPAHGFTIDTTTKVLRMTTLRGGPNANWEVSYASRAAVSDPDEAIPDEKRDSPR